MALKLTGGYLFIPPRERKQALVKLSACLSPAVALHFPVSVKMVTRREKHLREIPKLSLEREVSSEYIGKCKQLFTEMPVAPKVV